MKAKPIPPTFVISPFTIVIDSNEQRGEYKFQNMADDKTGLPIIPQIVHRPLYREGLADYTIDGMEHRIQIERKTLSDFYGSILGGREDFEQEIARLNQWCDVAYLMIEAEWSDLAYGTSRMQGQGDTAATKAAFRTASRTHDSWTIKYPRVHWITCAGRGHAERKTYRLLDMFWRKEMERLKRHGIEND